MKKIAGLLGLCITLPIWFYLLYWMLKKTGAGELQMFLFWVYVPVGFFVQALARLADED